MQKLGAMRGWHGEPRRCLDVGCGNGRNSRYMESLGFEVVSLDWSPEYGLKYDLRQGALPVFAGTVDVVLLNYVLMFMPGDERDALVAAVAKALSPMGVAVVEFFHAKQSFCPTKAESVATCAEVMQGFEAAGKMILLRGKERFLVSNSRICLT
jgi:SAM-dependent methyltransferase